MTVMTHVTVAHTADVAPATLAAARALLYEVFDDMEDDDWEHSLGGMHAVAWDGADLIGHAALIQRRLLHRGRALRAGYVEGVAVRADHRRRGVGAAMMAELERVARGAYDVAALGATDEAVPFYTGRGWLLWRGPTSALTPTGIVRTADDDGAVFVLPLTADLDLDGELTCDWRGGDVW
jgi:aminoglycoside 2'-N-acetyltransferase I